MLCYVIKVTISAILKVIISEVSKKSSLIGSILTSVPLLSVLKIIKLAKATYKKMVQNLIWATGYNAVAIPLFVFRL